MEDLSYVVRLAGAVTFGLILPQVFGRLVYVWLRRTGRGPAGLAIFIPPIMYFIVAFSFWWHEAYVIRSAGYYVCGAVGALAWATSFFGTFGHFAAAIVAWLRSERRSKRIQVQEG
jgi:hypothetical protein